MACLFVVFTPLQMLVSQQILRQEEITDALLLESYFPEQKSFQQIFDVCRIEKLWKKRLDPIEDFFSWDAEGLELHKTALRTWRRSRYIIKMLKDNSIDTIYLADYQNQTYRFTCVWLSKLGVKVNFFEEGYSHYVPRVYNINDGFLSKIKLFLIDVLYYIPLYHVRFAKWRNCPNRPYHGLPINKRFSIVPGFLNEVYDYRLYCEPMLSEKLQWLLGKEIDIQETNHNILLLTDPMSEVLNEEFRCLYCEVIKESLSALPLESHIFIKHHPRETDSMKQSVIEIVKSLNLSYKVIMSEVSIPVEYILLKTKFDRILFFNTSTYFYNGNLFPRCNFVKLLPRLLEKSKKAHAPENNIKQMQMLIDKMNSCSHSCN